VYTDAAVISFLKYTYVKLLMAKDTTFEQKLQHFFDLIAVVHRSDRRYRHLVKEVYDGHLFPLP